MPFTSRHRHDLLAIVALLLGIFVGLSLLPLGLTGPLGSSAGRSLWNYLGFGAVLIPVLGLSVALAGFGRLPALSLWRAAALCGGLIILVPFAIGVGMGISSIADLPPSYEDWSVSERLVGLVPALLAVGVTATVGTAGAVIVGLIALSGLTMTTLDWHPFKRLAPRGAQELLGDSFDRPSQGGAVQARPGGSWTEEIDPDEPPRRNGMEGSRVRPGLLPGRRRSDGSGRLAVGEAAADELPPLDLLAAPRRDSGSAGEAELDELGEVLVSTLATFKVEGKVVGRTTGPVVTQYEIAPGSGVKVGRISSLADDLALAMRAQSIRIVAPIPGRGAVGVEVPNPKPRIVTLRELIEAPEWDRSRSSLPIALGRDLEGNPVVADLAKMPHLLIAGATGSGKSVCINTIVTSLIYHYTPHLLRMLMIDPKMVELSSYNALPHLRHPVVTNNHDAAQTLKWAVIEMERRYELFHANACRNLHDFNRKVVDGKELFGPLEAEPDRKDPGRDGVASGAQRALLGAYGDGLLPYVVIIVDELADLMMTVQGEVETPLALLAQKARATGIHLILATQRPSVNVITGLIKANFPSRIAFRVASKVDSRTILDQNGAEALLGNGDMLFLPPGKSEPIRVQGAFVGTEETEVVTGWYQDRKTASDDALRAQGLITPDALEEDILTVVRAKEAADQDVEEPRSAEGGERDALFRDAAEVCLHHQLGSTSLLQRKLRIGYGRAARIIDQLQDAGILGPPDGSKPREVLIGGSQLEEFCG